MNNIKQLEGLNNRVEKLSCSNQIEILRIIHEYSPELISENKNGCFIEMNMLSNNVLEKISKYIDFIENNEKSLKNVELQKNKFKEIIDDA
jgi:hypothetical protein